MPRGNFNKRSAEPIAGTAGFTSIVTAFDPHFVAQTVDRTVNGTAADLCSIALVLAAPHSVQIFSSYTAQSDALANGNMQLTIDGVAVVRGRLGVATANYEGGALNWQASLAAGAHTIALRLNSIGGNLYCRPVAAAGEEFSNLTVNVFNI